MKRLFTALALLATLLPLQSRAETYALDPARTTIEFKVRNMGIMSVTGLFEKFKGTVTIDDKEISRSKVDVVIETSSINTGINRRDNHLRSADFFDVEKFPTMTFVSNRVEVSDGKLKVSGNLTIKGVARNVELLVDGPRNLPGGQRRTANATATVDRQDFGVSWGAVIGDEVSIRINAELVK